MKNSSCPPLSNTEWPIEIADLRDGFAGKLNVYRVMAHHPALLRAWAPYRQHVVSDTALGAENSEVVILRTGYRMKSHYEWAHHVCRARKLGFSDARIAAIQGTPEDCDRLIVAAVDSLIDKNHLPHRLEGNLAKEIGRAGVIDLIATVGFYSVLGYLLMTYDTPIDDDIAEELATQPVPL